MSTLKIQVANFFAKNSCSAWQSNQAIRRFCRRTYRFIMEHGATDYPYANWDFANWPESNKEGGYSLVSDSCNFVIRHSPSYVAWLIKEKFGKWPKLPIPGKRIPGEYAFSAKHWDEVLEYNGWTRRKTGPVCADVFRNKYYIGVIPDEGEFGQVVWLVHSITERDCEKNVDRVVGWIVSTYERQHQTFRRIPIDSKGILWYAKKRS